ncbi:hypothetical protein Tco_0484829 [Tanacetum coccineum]
MEDDLFAYELGVIDDFYFPCIEQPCDNLKNGDLDVYEPQQCYDEYERIFAEAVILIDNKLVKLIDIMLEQWLHLKFRDHKQVGNEIVEEVVSTWLIRSYKKQFEEYMEIKRQLEKEEEESSEDAWSNYSPNNDNDAIQVDQERFNNHKPIEGNDDTEDLEDYLIPQDASYYVDEEEERFKERKSKLLGIP